MSQVFLCGCGRKTTDPFVIKGVKMCVICAEDEAPAIVASRERRNTRHFQERRVPMYKYRE